MDAFGAETSEHSPFAGIVFAMSDPVGPDARAALVAHLTKHSLRTDGPFTLRSGAISDWYMDARQTTFAGEGLWAVGEAVAAVLDPEVDAIGGLTMGADPIAFAAAAYATQHGRPLDAFSVRKTAKEHGLGGRMVGAAQAGANVCVIDDTSTTGGAIIEALESAIAEGLNVKQAIVLFDRSGGVVSAAMSSRDIPYQAILVPADLGLGS